MVLILLIKTSICYDKYNLSINHSYQNRTNNQILEQINPKNSSILILQLVLIEWRIKCSNVRFLRDIR